MKKSIQMFSGIVIVAVGVVICMILAKASNLSVSYECQVDFFYEFDRPFVDPGRGILKADESNRRARYEDIVSNFKNEVFLLLLKDGPSRCQRDSILQSESESRIRAVLASVRLDVIGMPSTNFVYPCRLVLSDVDSRNLCEYARLCMDIVKDQIEDKNRISVAKATVREHQMLMRAERRIEELKKAATKGESMPAAEEEMRLARYTIEEMKKKIEAVREFVMSTGGRRIIQESQPEISWVVRRKPRKEKAP